MKQDFTSWCGQILQDPQNISLLKFGMSQDEDGFTVCTPLDAAPPDGHLGRDKDHFYQNDERIEEPLWLERLHKMTQELERKENSNGLFEDTA